MSFFCFPKKNRAIYELWVDEISHRVHTIALVTALLCARRIVQKKVDEEKRMKEEKELEEKRRIQREQARKQREEVRREKKKKKILDNLVRF